MDSYGWYGWFTQGVAMAIAMAPETPAIGSWTPAAQTVPMAWKAGKLGHQKKKGPKMPEEPKGKGYDTRLQYMLKRERNTVTYLYTYVLGAKFRMQTSALTSGSGQL